MILLPLAADLNTLQAIIDSTLPTLQLQPSIRPIGEKQRIPRVLLNSLRVKILSLQKLAVLESLVALLLESVGQVGHLTRLETEIVLLRERCSEIRDSIEGSWECKTVKYMLMLIVG